VLGAEVAAHRLGVLSEIIRLVLTMVPQQRTYSVHEPDAECGAGTR